MDSIATRSSLSWCHVIQHPRCDRCFFLTNIGAVVAVAPNRIPLTCLLCAKARTAWYWYHVRNLVVEVDERIREGLLSWS